MVAQQVKQLEAQKKPNIARKTARIINTEIGVNSSATGHEKDEGDPRAALAARTRERLNKYGIINLRTHDVYCLKRVHLPPDIIAKCPAY